MTNALRQKAFGATAFVVVLYALAVVMWFVSAESAWKKAAKKYSSAKQAYLKEERLIGEKRHWQEEYENKKAAMPTFEIGKATDTTWLKRMEDTAKANLVLISQDEAKSEIEAGDVLELPIEVRSWEGSLEALVKFMYELENSDSGMFDIVQLNFKPSSKKGYLRGSFTLNCAYMREK